MDNLTSKDESGRILVNGIHKICNIPSQCSGSDCYKSCLMNVLIERLYELEHQNMKNANQS